MGSPRREADQRDRRKERRAADSLPWPLYEWDRDRGKPPAIVLIGAWTFYGPMALICFGFALFFLAGIFQSASEGPIVGLALTLAAAGVAAFGYYLFWKPLWRIQCYYWNFELLQSQPQEPSVLPGEEEGPASHTPDEAN